MHRPQTTKPLVSVVCAWYNRAAYLRDTLDSLLSQTYENFEIVLVNDGSTDPAVATILAEYAASNPNLRVITQKNQGFVIAIRNAIEQSTGDYIAVQGAGDVSMPERLARQVFVLEENPNLCGVACRRYRVTVGGPANGSKSTSPEVPETVDLDYLMTRENPISHGEVMYRRAAYFSVGGYRPFFRFAQDIDLFIRMATLGSFKVLSDILYERRVFFDDGIANNRNKIVLQRALHEFARQCARDRSDFGDDMLDSYGPAGALLAGRVRKPVSRFLAIISIQYLALGHLMAADRFSKMAFEQAAGFHAVAARALLAISMVSPLGRRLIESLLKLHPKYEAWSEKS